MVTVCNVVPGCAAEDRVSAVSPRGPGVCALGSVSSTNTSSSSVLSLSLVSSLSFPCLSPYRHNESAASLLLLAQNEGGVTSMSPTRMLRL